MSICVQCPAWCACRAQACLTTATAAHEQLFLAKLPEAVHTSSNGGMPRLIEDFQDCIGASRMAQLLSTKLWFRGRQVSLLWAVADFQGFDKASDPVFRRFWLCVRHGATFDKTYPLAHCEAWTSNGGSMHAFFELLDCLGAYPVCGCSDHRCRARAARPATVVAVHRWHRWAARRWKRKWMALSSVGQP
jgi:hypothetical protein